MYPRAASLKTVAIRHIFGYWAFEMRRVQLRNGILNFYFILISLNVKAAVKFTYWKKFKPISKNVDMWVYFFNCEFYELWTQIKYILMNIQHVHEDVLLSM